jgi:tetratricopeptide (TPR) repeat protein
MTHQGSCDHQELLMNRRKVPSAEPRAIAASKQPVSPSAETVPVVSARDRLPKSGVYLTWAVCVFLVLAVVLVFGGTVQFDFVNYDDGILVYENPMVSRGLSREGVIWAFTTSVANMWYPLTWISYMLDSQFCGTKPWGYHATNVLLHAATSVILFLFLRRATGNFWASALVAAVFAIHPLRAEAVAWVGERKSPLSGLFFVATIAAYISFAQRPLSLLRYLAVAGLFTLGLLAKPTLVTLPFLFLLLDYWPLGRWRPARPGPDSAATPDASRGGESILLLVLEKVPLFMLSIACGVAAVLSQAGNIAPLNNVSLGARIANALISYVVYLRQFFWPTGLAAFYPQPDGHPAWQAGAAFCLLAAISLIALWAWHKQPALFVGWFWYLGTMLPTSGLVQIGSHARADRYTYLPHIGLGLAIVWLLRGAVERLCGHWPSRRGIVAAAACLVIAGLMACAWQQVSYWQNSMRLWTHALDCTTGNVIAHCNLGLALADRGDFDNAIDHYHKALDIYPDDVECLNNLGLALAGRGQLKDAIACYARAVEIKPRFALAHNNLGIALAGSGRVDDAMREFHQALECTPDLATAHFNLGFALAGRRQFDAAIPEYREAVKIAPRVLSNHYCLALALAGRGKAGDLEEAIAEYGKVLEIDPDFVAAHIDLGVALERSGRADEAIGHYRRVLEIDPNYPEAHNNLGLILAKRREFDAAVAHFQQALKTWPDYLEAHFNLGIVLAQTGKPDEAQEHYQKALALAIARKDQRLADAIRARAARRPPPAPPVKQP